MDSRTVAALVGVVASLLASYLLWRYFHSAVFFLFVPFVPLLLRGRTNATESVRTCPTCGYQSRRDDVRYCPHDGSRLETED